MDDCLNLKLPTDFADEAVFCYPFRDVGVVIYSPHGEFLARPCVTTVTIDGIRFDAISTSFGLSTGSDSSGMPVMGSLNTSIHVQVDMHDDVNLPFSSFKKLFDLANVVTRDKIRAIKIEYWKDENRQDALVSYSFNGWISNFVSSSGGGDGSNHMLIMNLQPAMNKQNFSDIQVSN